MNIDLKKNYPKIIGGIVILVAVFYLGQYTKSESDPYMNHVEIPADITVTDEQFESFWKVWRILSQKYVGATTTDSQKRVWGAIQGLTASQGDPYTVFFPPEESALFKSDISGTFEGIGMEIGIKDGILTVVSPLKDSPAYKAGVRSGEKILKIGDMSTLDLPVDKAVKMIRGAKDTVVKITFLPVGSTQPVERSIVRGIIDIPTIQIESRNTSSSTSTQDSGVGLRKDGVFVIKLFSFTSQAPDLFRKALRDFVESGSHKMIIDLRGNPGGYLDAAWDMASWFLPAGKLIVTEDFGGKDTNRTYKSKGYDIFKNSNFKLIILVDAGSASASEIFAGALREHGVAKIVGVKTFGKGSVQELIQITPDTSLKVTIASWLTPNGHNLSHDGLNPDVEVKVSQKDIDAKRDTQMDKAVEILRKEP
jgi:carboxyl-terminal processing protease